ncbi:MAG: cupin domain-containing protein [Candidatus Bathyarchaeota archaeon]|nr:cupin domain-containing protein [Candidatus Bathyarchaeota archaeon]
MIPVLDIEEKIKEIVDPWTPIDVAYVNDQVIRMALFHGKYHWHKHSEEDELFYVVKGSITIKVMDQPDIELKDGQLCVIPKNVEHCPISQEPSYVLLFEPSALKSKGD